MNAEELVEWLRFCAETCEAQNAFESPTLQAVDARNAERMRTAADLIEEGQKYKRKYLNLRRKMRVN